MGDWLKGWPDSMRWVALLPVVAACVFTLLRSGFYFFTLISVDPNGFIARIFFEFFTGFIIIYAAQHIAPKGKFKVGIIMFVLILLGGAYALTVKMGVVEVWGAIAMIAGAGVVVYYQRRQMKRLAPSELEKRSKEFAQATVNGLRKLK